MRTLVCTIVCAVAVPAYAFSLPQEAATLKQKFAAEVGGTEIDAVYETALLGRAAAAVASRAEVFAAPQYFLLVDRNPDRQVAALAFVDREAGRVVILGSSRASTGNPKRVGHYETPVGVFKNMVEHMSYRALGTKNAKGWRGLGAKGSRVYDLGWQRTLHPKGGTIDIRMLVHATDPQFGEPRLGTRDSKGCVRLPGAFARFLDHYGILDAEYEQSEKGRRVLQGDRERASLAGSAVVVVDSGR